MKLLNTKIFTTLFNTPLIGGILTLIFLVPIINNKQGLSEHSKQGILMQLFAPGLYLVARTISYFIWFLFGLTILEKAISWMSFFWLLFCYGYMIRGIILIFKRKKELYPLFRKPLTKLEKNNLELNL